MQLDSGVFTKMDTADSLQLIATWKMFITDLEAAKNMSYDSVECWSTKDFEKGDYVSVAGPVSIDACIQNHLIQLKNTSFWPFLKSNDYSVHLLKRDSEKEPNYYIVFPRCETEFEKMNTFKYYFYFQKAGNRLLFKGYNSSY
jgi:hypothetical protein